MTDESLKDRVIKDLVLLSTVGIRPILVHGGGPEINGWLKKVGIEPKVSFIFGYFWLFLVIFVWAIRLTTCFVDSFSTA